MNDNVVGLHDKRFQAAHEPNPRVIEQLESFLERARRGEIDGIAIAVSRPNNHVAFNYYLGPTSATFRVIAAVGILSTDMHTTVTKAVADKE